MKASKPAGISEKVIRLLDIYTRIARREYPSVNGLREHFRVSERTVYRYLEIINIIDSIEFDDERKGYRFVHGDRIKKTSLSDNELLVLLAAGEAISHLGEPLAEGFRELINRVAVTAKRAGEKGRVPIVVKIPDAVETEKLPGYFKTISQNIDEKRSVEMVYKAQHSKETTSRLVDPYGLVFYEGAWICVGYCHLRKQMRSFALDRILGLKEPVQYFWTVT